MNWKVLGVVSILRKHFLFSNHVLIDLAVWKNSKKHIKKFKERHHANNTRDIQEINKEFRKEFGVPDRMAIPGNLDNLINK
jgi:hypothetical protein